MDTVNREQTSIRDTIRYVCQVMDQNGYNSLTQLAGYILSEDPTYIPNCANIRRLLSGIDRDELLHEILTYYLENENNQT